LLVIGILVVVMVVGIVMVWCIEWVVYV